ncbi:hypothetical protein NG895_04580 [Aeoliella sp. ICT_H6.2]|uniref:PEP-CTERM protein-sorting domain-containing protein n=1 Tax=Aeoliella straminimaris TaxID=2954799 RepID=A0A9X2F6I0_9BACT|nr:hypothetical protein [Aeoliella straminimaris]MCO6043172.1 hypothetical protein [Aeoliella straminimaris]
MRRHQTLPFAILVAVTCSMVHGEDPPGDFDGSGWVDGRDVDLVVSNWGASLPPIPAGFYLPPTGPRVDNDDLNNLIRGWDGGASLPIVDIRHTVRVLYTPATLVGPGYVSNDIFISFPGQLGGQQLSIQLTAGSIYNHSLGGATEPHPALLEISPDLAFDTYVTTGALSGAQPGTSSAWVGGAVNLPDSLSAWSLEGQTISATWIRALTYPVSNQTDFGVARITLSPDAAGSGSFLTSTVEGSEWMRSLEVVDGQIVFSPSNVPGDFNDDGVVDLADYTVWRNHLGAPAGTLPNDSTGLTIGNDQYETWRTHFGDTALEPAVYPVVSVPEPAAFLAAFILSGIWYSSCRRSPHK